MQSRIGAITTFLEQQKCKLDLYTSSMEVQVNVLPSPDNTRVTNKRGSSIIWTDGEHEWSSFRIPYNSSGSSGEPHYKDTFIDWPFDKYVQAIGLTGWDWENRVSRWVGFDFDSITNHAKGLSHQELNAIRLKAQQIPWVTVRRSKSGKGLHIYVHLDPVVPTANHSEHAALAHSILSMLSGLLGFDFQSKVDCIGSVLWIWHRDASESQKSFTTIKQGEPLRQVPADWESYIGKTSRTKTIPSKLADNKDKFEQLQQSLKRTQLDDTHRELLTWFANRQCTWWWDAELNSLICHTHDLKVAHKELNYKGIFFTSATGKDAPNDHNCFCFPQRDGSWSIYRFNPNVDEHEYWQVSSSGWKYCYFNKVPDLTIASRLCGGTKTKKGSQNFRTLLDAVKALKYLGVKIKIPSGFGDRPTVLEYGKAEGEIVIITEREEKDSNPPDWYAASGVRGSPGPKWETVIQTEVETRIIDPPDDLIRHTQYQGESRWFLKVRDVWIPKGRTEVVDVLKAIGYNSKEIPNILGQAILDHWDIVAIPFSEEYPGNRQWNLKGAQLAFDPVPGSFTSWETILIHLGRNIITLDNEWCQINNVTNGVKYLLYWIASLFQYPTEPLPYLFLYGGQDVGKSILHEALALLFKDGKGYQRADHALTSQSGHNGELHGAILCAIEEVDLSKNPRANERMKDWVTGKTIAIRDMGTTTFTTLNTTHWIQVANPASHCPIFPGDTRITVIPVSPLENLIPKKELIERLIDEAPAFLHHILSINIPPSDSRLRIPCLKSIIKSNLEEANRSHLDEFLEDHCAYIEGALTNLDRFMSAFMNFLPAKEQLAWDRKRVMKGLPVGQYPKGKYKNSTFIGNLILKGGIEGQDYLLRSSRIVRDNSGSLVELREGSHEAN